MPERRTRGESWIQFQAPRVEKAQNPKLGLSPDGAAAVDFPPPFPGFNLGVLRPSYASSALRAMRLRRLRMTVLSVVGGLPHLLKSVDRCGRLSPRQLPQMRPIRVHGPHLLPPASVALECQPFSIREPDRQLVCERYLMSGQFVGGTAGIVDDPDVNPCGPCGSSGWPAGVRPATMLDIAPDPRKSRCASVGAAASHPRP